MRRPVNGQEDGDMGRYEVFNGPETQTPQGVFDYDQMQPGFSNAVAEGSESRPEVDVVVNVKHPSRFRKYLAVGAAGIALTGVGAKLVERYMPSMPQVVPEATHSVEVEISAPETEVVRNVSINIADVRSEFDYYQRTSLRRWGPAPNCDMTIDDTARTRSNASVLVEEAEITTLEDEATIEVTGDVLLDSHTSVSGGLLDMKIASGGMDVCTNSNEINWAERFAYGREEDKEKGIEAEAGIIENAGRIALACAMVREGEDLLGESILHNARIFSDKLKDIDPENIMVVYNGDFKSEMEAEAYRATANFNREFDKVAAEYISETKNKDQKIRMAEHDVKLNARDLLDCDKHEITVTRQG